MRVLRANKTLLEKRLRSYVCELIDVVRIVYCMLFLFYGITDHVALRMCSNKLDRFFDDFICLWV